ncbi:MAG: TetR/AcrR family transcriptional regulator [Leptospiraceae bacterium]|jgi:AcrR family transcriptional regulator|nr:TetR/AcrR family transcriptional regulator [Leptospiraceae bacterium]MCZ8345851.1 TetR/AcrR family transcriptional regulator [Leptospiraceae bacterium]PJD99069.1 MAG: AcrR family transcriptional regulator [Leptospira sp.]
MNRKKGKRSYHHGDLENSLIKSSLFLLKDKKATDLSLREIAKSAGVSHTAVYRHFKDKESLFNKIAAIGFDRLAVYQANAATHGEDSKDSFRRAGLAYIKFSLRFPGWYQLMFQRRYIQPDAILKRAMIRSYSVLVQLSKDYIKDKNLSVDPKEYAMYAWSIVHGYSSLAIDSDFPQANAKSMQSTVRGLAEKIMKMMA